MSYATETPSAGAALNEIISTISAYLLDTVSDFQDWIATPTIRKWIRIIVIVFGYLMVRPWIELFFKKMFERQMDKDDAERKKKREEEEGFLAEGVEKARKSGNSLRVGGGQEEEGSEEEAEEEKIKASGVMEWGRGARKRAKKVEKKKLKEQMTEEELLELLDWSESDAEGEKKGAA
ncbi:trafficking PGA2-domain-containing protein [Talaromyces proteolyticus]|uniref:Trafficking PGA2-domain-containing protein n=1 Tax=Talaromyces proteolyticus TaxID=1131652 RepID=A0AAD4KJ88_9EURO|nr:trafficking PGA2-domain-containing protein [Talaromyces proteolyticus]KAH8692289.1 trafficking PGA2-domain-containing protein [Talaromyces proteolyticus]